MQERRSPQDLIAALLRRDDSDDYLRVPGLLRRWEISDVVETGHEFRLEEAGTAADGTPLYALYRRERSAATGARR